MRTDRCAIRLWRTDVYHVRWRHSICCCRSVVDTFKEHTNEESVGRLEERIDAPRAVWVVVRMNVDFVRVEFVSVAKEPPPPPHWWPEITPQCSCVICLLSLHSLQLSKRAKINFLFRSFFKIFCRTPSRELVKTILGTFLLHLTRIVTQFMRVLTSNPPE